MLTKYCIRFGVPKLNLAIRRTTCVFLQPQRFHSNTSGEPSRPDGKVGTIDDYFDDNHDPALQVYNAATKQELRRKFSNTLDNPANLRSIWNLLLDRIKMKQDKMHKNDFKDLIPCIEMSMISKCKDSTNFSDVTDKIGHALRDTGVFIVRNVMSEKEALGYKESVQEYIESNNGQIGHPKANPQVYEIYWSKAQLEARQHPNMVEAMRFANNLWSFNDSITRSIDGHAYSVDVPFCYVDRLRMRDPGDESFKLGCHIDGGSIERWKDEYYSQCYTDIFNGNIDKYNAFDASYRIFAKMDHFNTQNNCSVFRTFQGWLSLSHCSPTQGSLQVNPMLREATAYVMLRPFIDQNLAYKNEFASDGSDVYTFNAISDDSNFGNVYAGKGLQVKNEYHEILCDTMVGIPHVNPGDLVLWHCDTIHKVDEKNTSDGDSSVFYIPTCFDCDINNQYAIKQKEHFIDGLTPPDFPQNHVEQKFVNRATVNDLTDLGKLIFHI